MEIALIRERDGNRCAKCGGTSSLHVHHRIRRSQGGRDCPANLITLCFACHTWVHANPYAAEARGLLLRPHLDPALVEVRHHMWPAAPVWLLDPGLGFALLPPGTPDLPLIDHARADEREPGGEDEPAEPFPVGSKNHEDISEVA